MTRQASIDAARSIVEGCWRDDEIKHKPMDAKIIEAFTKRLAVWIDLSNNFLNNSDFYCRLLDQCAEHLGPEVFIADDGSIMDEPLRLKIPELVKQLAEKAAAYDNLKEELQQAWDRDLAEV